MTAPIWDPQQYSRFEAERDRAALDLLVRLPEDLSPTEIWDLGCGTGQHAALLKRRHPRAHVHGLDADVPLSFHPAATRVLGLVTPR
ncbi:methyltransferase, partial [Brevundimonas faecalis]|uniref:methyltransferase n=1 Tax=Brevundimonas faecalis TaxID=947378 RepID=UPI00360B6C8A